MVRDASPRRALLLLDDARAPNRSTRCSPTPPTAWSSPSPRPAHRDPRRPAVHARRTGRAVRRPDARPHAGPTRITVDPRTAETSPRSAAASPPRWSWRRLARRPAQGLRRRRHRALLRAHEDSEQPSGGAAAGPRLPAGLRLAAAGPARVLRLLALAPAGLVDAHTASALAGCSVPAAATTLDDFAAPGCCAERRRPAQYRLPGCLARSLRARAGGAGAARRDPAGPGPDAGAHRTAAPGLPGDQRPRVPRRAGSSPGCRARCASPRGRAADWLRGATRAAGRGPDRGRRRRPRHPRPAAGGRACPRPRRAPRPEAAAPELYPLHGLVLDVAERRGLPREKAAALLNLARPGRRTGRTREALARYRAALDAGAAANDPAATGRAMESAGGTYAELGTGSGPPTGTAGRWRCGSAREERADAARLHGRLGAVHTYAGPVGRGAAGLARRRRRPTAGSATRRPGAGAERGGPGAGVRGPARRSRCGPAGRRSSWPGGPVTCGCRRRWTAAGGHPGAARRPAAARLHRAAADRLLGEERP